MGRVSAWLFQMPGLIAPTEVQYKDALIARIGELLNENPKQARRKLEDDGDFAYVSRALSRRMIDAS